MRCTLILQLCIQHAPGLDSPAQHAMLRARVTALPFCQQSQVKPIKRGIACDNTIDGRRVSLWLQQAHCCFVVKREYHECCAVARLSEHAYLGVAGLSAEHSLYAMAIQLRSSAVRQAAVCTYRAARVLLLSSTKHERAHLQCIKWVAGHRLVCGGHKGT